MRGRQETVSAIQIALLPAEIGDDAQLMTSLADQVNEIYDAAEEGLWLTGTARTTTSEMSSLVRAGQIAVASSGGDVTGCVRVHLLGRLA